MRQHAEALDGHREDMPYQRAIAVSQTASVPDDLGDYMTENEKELIEIIAGLVDQHLGDSFHTEDVDRCHSWFVRINKTAMMKLVEVGLMAEVYPEAKQGESLFRGYDARFVPNWRWKLWRELK